MNRNYTILAALLMAVTLVFVTVVPAAAAERMKYEDYQRQLKAYQDREAAARTAIDAEQQAIAALRTQLADLESHLAGLWDEKFAALGITREAYEAYLKRIEGLEARVDELAKMTPEALLNYAKELDDIAAQIASMLTDPIARLKAVNERLTALAARVERLKASLPKPKHDMYTVVRGDCLWRIAKKPEIYADPFKWLRIWSANKTMIRDPDLIYPKQQFAVPRLIGPGEYLVKRGDSLKKIAGMADVYGDPFQWTKIYQANKTGKFLDNPNVIYPEMILSIPRN
ncbi:MAG: LysM peptidoglycan-binding domain-containing protein [Calditrichaeota bacterium]|nr:LysM peptidoglycan-binding domain-containing protein [Calditrichota bacterium]